MLMDIETGRQNKIKPKKIKNKDRLIARMILGVGLSLSIASAVACGITHPKFSDAKDEHWDALEIKDAYLDTYEQIDEFKTTYNADVQALNDRLIARAIDGYTYETELDKLNTNEYTEKVLVENADEQTKAEFNEINQKYLDADNNWNKNAMPFMTSLMCSYAFPVMTAFNYRIWKPRSKKGEELEEKHPSKIDPETMKRVMQIDDTPYHGGNYYPINAEETRKYASSVLKSDKVQDTENNNTI